jgi:hypothetical protein
MTINGGFGYQKVSSNRIDEVRSEGKVLVSMLRGWRMLSNEK